MFTIELQPTEGGRFHCFFCGGWFQTTEAGHAVVFEDGQGIDTVCPKCLQLDAEGRRRVVHQQAHVLHEVANALEDLLVTGLPAAPSYDDWRRFAEAMLRAPLADTSR